MVKGLYTAAMGMNVQAKRLDIISHDLAHASTAGYKKEGVAIGSFKEEYIKRLNDTQQLKPYEATIGQITYGAKIEEVYTDFTQGSVVATGNQKELAIQGSGFFVIDGPSGRAYTRDGSFLVNEQGNLVTSEGYAVIGNEGPIILGEDFFALGEEMVIQGKGEIYVDGVYQDTLQLVDFEDPQSLTKQGNNLYQGEGQERPFTGNVLQGYLETSNVNTVNAMVDMITVARTYETNQKMIQTLDNVLGKAVNELGRG